MTANRDCAAEAAMRANHHITGVRTCAVHEDQLDEMYIAPPVGHPPVIGFEAKAESFEPLDRSGAV